MKVKVLLFGLALGIFALTSCENENSSESSEIAITTHNDTIDYCLGVSICNNLKTQGVDTISSAIIAKGFDDIMNGEPMITVEEAGTILNNHFMALQQKNMEIEQQKWEKNKIAGEEFIAKNKDEEGVITLESGLQYKILASGNGKQATINSMVTVHYHGTLIDGTVFDSSVERGEPAQFPVNGVIPGWQEILPLMKIGDKWKVFIPQELAYGQNPRQGGVIEPLMALVFEMELIAVNDAPTE